LGILYQVIILKMQEIKFTVEQVNQLLNALGELSFKQAAPIIQYVRSIAEPQLAPPQEDKPQE